MAAARSLLLYASLTLSAHAQNPDWADSTDTCIAGNSVATDGPVCDMPTCYPAEPECEEDDFEASDDTCTIEGYSKPTDMCTQTMTCPKQSNYLQFCRWFNQGPGACCIPGHDADDQDMFENLIDGLGPGCKNPMMYPEIRHFYCLGCDPKQPSYVCTPKNGPWTRGPEYDADPDQEDASFSDEGYEKIIRVCRSFAESLWSGDTKGGLKNPQGNKYDQCGVMKANPCLDIMEDFDPYQCGDDLVIPSTLTKGMEEGNRCNYTQFPLNAQLFINHFKPPNMDDFYFLIVDDTKRADCDNCKPGMSKHGPCFHGGNTSSGMTVAISWVSSLVAMVACALQLRNF